MAELAESGGGGAADRVGPDAGGAPQTPHLDPTASVSPWSWSSNHHRGKKLVLHVDLNNTILVSDAVTAQGTVAALENFLSTVTWGRMSRQGKRAKPGFRLSVVFHGAHSGRKDKWSLF